MSGFNSGKFTLDWMAIVFLIVIPLTGCATAVRESVYTATPTRSEPTFAPPTQAPTPTSVPLPSPVPAQPADYRFPEVIDRDKRYLFYLHGKIIEDQGLPAISPEYGPYEYDAILETLNGYDFVVIAEQRARNTDGWVYAQQISEQVTTLLQAGVPAENITIVGASKGAGIAVFISHILENEAINYVFMAICHPDLVDSIKQNKMSLFGHILSIYDSVDTLAGSCQELFASSIGRGISRYDEVVLSVGTGHGILYKPLDEWIVPVVQWANPNGVE